MKYFDSKTMSTTFKTIKTETYPDKLWEIITEAFPKYASHDRARYHNKWHNNYTIEGVTYEQAWNGMLTLTTFGYDASGSWRDYAKKVHRRMSIQSRMYDVEAVRKKHAELTEVYADYKKEHAERVKLEEVRKKQQDTLDKRITKECNKLKADIKPSLGKAVARQGRSVGNLRG